MIFSLDSDIFKIVYVQIKSYEICCLSCNSVPKIDKNTVILLYIPGVWNKDGVLQRIKISYLEPVPL